MTEMKIQKIGADPGAPYRQMYVTLFKAVTAALYMIEDNELMKARALLMEAQRETEELYVGGRSV